MKNKVHYGEFTLSHWIRLMLTQDIILPEYQRQFVWRKDNIKTFISGLSEDTFIPPVTIGRYKVADGTYSNLILDGQQRLTSLLLSKLNKIPILEDSDEWQYSKLIDPVNPLNNRLEEIERRIDSMPGVYEDLGEPLNADFFTSHFLGYSYIVPVTDDISEQQAFYSSVFLNINTGGTKLSRMQSRQALYYFNSNITGILLPELDIRVKVGFNKTESLDFPRYLALVSQYYKKQNFDVIAYGWSKDIDGYILSYIHSVNHETDIDNRDFGKFSALFPGNLANERLALLKDNLELLFGFGPIDFLSIIDADMWIIGLVYHVMFKGKRIVNGKTSDLRRSIQYSINRFRNDDLHSRTPNAVKYIKMRMEKSIERYSRFVQ